jgi:hypothetical protein
MKIGSSLSSLLPLLVGGVFLLLSSTLSEAIEVGDILPADSSLQFGFPPEEISLNDRFKGKNVLLM